MEKMQNSKTYLQFWVKCTQKVPLSVFFWLFGLPRLGKTLIHHHIHERVFVGPRFISLNASWLKKYKHSSSVVWIPLKKYSLWSKRGIKNNSPRLLIGAIRISEILVSCLSECPSCPYYCGRGGRCSGRTAAGRRWCTPAARCSRRPWGCAAFWSWGTTNTPPAQRTQYHPSRCPRWGPVCGSEPSPSGCSWPPCRWTLAPPPPGRPPPAPGWTLLCTSSC